MKKFKVVEIKGEKKYRPVDVCKALDTSSGALSTFMSKRYGTGTRDGLTISQIIEYINAPHREKKKQEPDEGAVAEILDELAKRGIVERGELQMEFRR